MRRVQRSKDKEELVKGLTSGETPLFREIWRLLLFAAALGYKTGRREPLGEVDAGRAMPQSYFTNNPAWPGFQHLLALVCSEDAQILGGGDENDDLRLTVFEEYANGGLSILQEVMEQSSYSLDALIHLVAQHTTEKPVPSLAKIEI